MIDLSIPSPGPLEELYAISPRGITMGLERMREACTAVGSPQNAFPSIQVAGTNGKGSVSTMLERAFRHSGYRTGLFTSPHIHRYTERIRINAKEIDIKELAPHLELALSLTRGSSGIPLTFFEVSTLAALLAFRQYKIDVAVMEVGLGGRLDATSVVPAIVGVITSISLDHCEYLGTTLPQIAKEKAGIAKPGMKLFCGRVSSDARCAIEEETTIRSAKIEHVTNALTELPLHSGTVPFFGQPHQSYNASLALRAFCEMNSLLKSVPHAEENFIAAMRDFQMPCRCESIWVGDKHFLLDGAHNTEAVEALVATLKSLNLPVSRIIFGALRGKPVTEMLALLRGVSRDVVLVEAPVERTVNVEELAISTHLPHMSMQQAISSSIESGITVVTGSFFVAAHARRILLDEVTDPPVGL